ncbi:unnamed protein product [Rotaria sp. Silwood2]|nr:unnamed protein product [Rotaria sp. Silwood2]CAF2845655.1 unnamed protein product [Rotaria sp. Silwood2]CAF3205743.1 unnamed protein product [Rotaria sp. Silwood2]CAF3293903.1 unnamed protein product [Rotaria sp. Silwood2]CAF3883373.1 unnamed protein product [Rotaria sp. Silwood2]
MAGITNTNTSSKVIRIQDDEKELLFRLREIYGNDYKKYSEYIKRESNVPSTIKKIYKLLDERKAYRRISDYFHRERAAKKAKDSHTNGISGSYTRSSTRGITQVPEQISSLHLDHDMDDEDDIDNDDEDNNTGTDNDQQQPASPTITNGSDEHSGINNSMNNDDEQQQQHHQQIQSSLITLSGHQRKRMLPLTNHRHPPPLLPPPPPSSFISSTMNTKSDLLSVRTHLEKALSELDRAIISKDEYNNDEQHGSIPVRNHLLTNGHRHSKLDDIVRSLSHVVNQQQENARLIIDESSVLLIDTEQQQKEDKQSGRLLATTQESIINVLERLNALVDRGNSIYDRVESILSEF